MFSLETVNRQCWLTQGEESLLVIVHDLCLHGFINVLKKLLHPKRCVLDFGVSQLEMNSSSVCFGFDKMRFLA